MKTLIERGLNTAQVRGATYADVRVVHTTTEEITVKNGRPEAISLHEDQGFGVRVIADGAWGFAASASPTPQEVDRVAAQAVAIARASARVKTEDVILGSPEAHVGTYHTPVQVDPFSVPLEDKVALLLAADEAMRGVAGVGVTQADLAFIRVRKSFGSTEGALVEQDLVESGGGIVALAVAQGEMQKRSYPNSFGRDQRTGGYEVITAMDLAGNASRIAEESVQLLSATQCPPGVRDIILAGDQLALQVHESCGHPTELDRVFGTEAAYAGTSFLTPDKLGAFRYGSDVVNIVADATTPGGLGTFGYDDEGVPAQRSPLVENGLFVGYLTSRETAARLGLRSNGTMRADGWNRLPIIRMTNINLDPGSWDPDDLIADTEDGIFMQTNKSWSIDDKRLNFQFGVEIAWEIQGGKLGRMLKNATYTGLTPRFWASCDAICSMDHWRVWGTPNCGKGQPGQVAHVGHGAAPARFRNVRVGVTG